MPKSAGHPVRISQQTGDSIRRWSARHNGYSGIEGSFLKMLKLAQKLTGTLRPSDSLEVVRDTTTLRDVTEGRTSEEVVVSNFLSFLYRDKNGLEPRKPNPLGVDPERPFDHEDVFLLPRHQFEFLLIARQKAVTFGADPKLTVHDVAAAIVENVQSVSANGRHFHELGQEFRIRRAIPAATCG